MTTHQRGGASIEMILVLPFFLLPLWLTTHSMLLEYYRFQLNIKAELIARSLSLSSANEWPSNLSTLPTINSYNSTLSSFMTLQYKVNCYNALGQLFATTNCTITNDILPTYIEVTIQGSLSNVEVIEGISNWVRHG
ncbi:MAG: hypothetical protein KGI88_01665 [Betaproteobacteria bacterium]|nr:hypothetical protein [Betaproteobacteria bacterium]MDE2055924.1 hypothetical protein [Betaproteobacteria bacterium]